MSRLFWHGVVTDLNVLQHAGSANMSVDIQAGDLMANNTGDPGDFSPTLPGEVPYSWNTAAYNIAIAAHSSNNRRDIVVAYVDLAVTNPSTATPNNPDALKFMVVQGTPATSPSDPFDSDIQAAVGASNPFEKLARVSLTSSTTQITNAQITDLRRFVALNVPRLRGGYIQDRGHLIPNVVDDTFALLNAVQILIGKSISLTGATGTGNILTNPYKFSVYRNAAWTTASLAYAKVQFDTEDYDSGANFDSTTNFRFTAPVAGFYHFDAGVQSNTIANGLVGNAIYVNGSLYKRVEIECGGNTTLIGPGISADIQLSVGDTVEVYHYGSSSTGGTGRSKAYFNGHLISHL
jgi:hypothetical protein